MSPDEIPIYFDADLSVLDGEIAVIGYGNQGQAQALNLRDSGLDVIVGNIDDEYRIKAQTDGFSVMSIEDAVVRAKYIMILIPDEIQPEVYRDKIFPKMSSEKVLCFASGYNITFGFIKPPAEIDMVLVAPRMIGAGVRQSYQEGAGFYSFYAVETDASGNAKDIALALAKGIGSMNPGGAVIEVSFRQEAELDLFNEQCFGPAFGQVLMTAINVAIDAGYPPEAALIEIYMSGEFSYSMKKMAELGLTEQLTLHSTCSQYGSMSRGLRYVFPQIREKMEETLQEIQDGSFAKEFAEEYEMGLETLEDLREVSEEMPEVILEKKVRERLKGP
jgi:ketol-acid reductoisomerase